MNQVAAPSLGKVNTGLAVVLLFLAIVVPGQLQYIKAGLLFAVLLTTLYESYLDVWKVNFTTLFFLLGWSTYGVSWVMLGILVDNPGVNTQLPLRVLWPLAYICLIQRIRTPQDLSSLASVIMYATLTVIAIGFTIIINGLLGSSGSSFLNEMISIIYPGAGFGEHFGYTHLVIANSNIVLFIFPMLVSLYLFHDSSVASRRSILFTLIMSASYIVLSGRRAFWAMIVLAPFIVLLLYFTVGKSFKLRFMVNGVLLFLSFFLATLGFALFAGFDGFFDRLQSAFISNSEPVRFEQASLLVQSWMKNLWFGNGVGAGITPSYTGYSEIWQVELSYLSELNQTGLFGITIYSFLILTPFILACRKLRTQDFSPVAIGMLAGYACTFLANASNPIISAFDSLWIAYIPLGILQSCKS